MPTNNLLEVSPYEIDRGELIGRDPKKLKAKDFIEANVELYVPTKAIRQFCLSCCCGQEAEVRKCIAVHCPLWALRMGNGLSREIRDHIRGGPAPKFNIRRKNDDEDEGDDE